MTRNRRGSALLIVLGMLAFMIISAVAFSAWMRSSRLPNSFLRRGASARMLAKAALAAAIDEIDASIGNNPHPGLGTRNYQYNEDGRVRGMGHSANRNLWMSRVFIGKKEDSSSDTARDHLLDETKTVSTLTLEGLAYIPPPFVNEARYYSRRSNAATWHNLAFDSGRYAFTAIDVSDCLDVNVLAANVGRSSTPYGRISLAYCFENASHQGYQEKPQDWDDFMKGFQSKSLAEAEVDGGKGQNISSKDVAGSSMIPLTSVADLNLAMYEKGGASGVAGLPCPFSQYVSSGATSFYGGESPTGDVGKRIRNMAFVTDSWMAGGSVGEALETSSGGGSGHKGQNASGVTEEVEELDLANEEDQPFLPGDLNAKKTAMAVMEQSSSECATRLINHISRMGLLMLYDYLDADNVPTSLALPSVERVPMVAGIKHSFDASSLRVNLQTKPESQETDDAYDGNYIVSPPATAGNTQTRRIRKEEIYKLDPGEFVRGIEGGFQAVVVYPFRRGTDVTDPDQFKIEAHVDFFLSSENMNLRTGNRSDVFHQGDYGLDQKFAENANVLHANGVFRVPYIKQTLNFNEVKDENSAVYNGQMVSFVNPNAGSQLAGMLNSDEGVLLRIVKEVTQKREKSPDDTGFSGQWQNQGDWVITDAFTGMSPISANGQVDDDFATPQKLVAYLKAGVPKKAKIRAAISVRVKNGDDRTVDIVPGGLLDDQNYNQINNIGAMEEMGNIISGRPGPMLLFSGRDEFEFTEAALSRVAQSFDLQPKGAICPDPRWNWAPEHWYQFDNVSAQGWLDEVKNNWLGKEGRDRDIFMMSSDVNTMQSVYELACLPRLTPLGNYGDDQMRGNMEMLNGANLQAIPGSVGELRNRHLFWRTYSPLYRKSVTTSDKGMETGRMEKHPDYAAYRDPFYSLNIVNRGRGFKVQPFATSTNAVLAALANTPSDWWAAGIDPLKQSGVTDSGRKSNVEQFNKDHAFNELSGTRAKFAWKDVERIASNFIAAMHHLDVATADPEDGVETIWQDAFDEKLNWSGDVTGSEAYEETFGSLVSNTSEILDAQTDDLADVDRKFLYGYWRECFSARQQLFLVFVRAEPSMMGGGSVSAVPPQLGARAVALVWRDPAPAKGYENDIKYPHRTRVLFYRQLD